MAQKEIQLLNQYIKTLEQENQSKLKEIDFLFAELNRTSDENKSLNEELNSLFNSQINNQTHSKTQQLEALLSQKDHEINRLLELIQSQRQSINKLSTEQNTTRTNKYSARQTQNSSDYTKKNSRTRKDSTEILEEYKRNLIENEKIIASLNQDLNQKDNQINYLIRSEDQSRQMISNYEIQISDLNANLEKIESNYSNLQGTNTKLKLENTQLLMEVKNLKNKIEVLQNAPKQIIQVDRNQFIKDLEDKNSQLSVKVMHWQYKEQQWDRESLQLHSKINRLIKQISLLKNQNGNQDLRNEKQGNSYENDYNQVQQIHQAFMQILDLNTDLIAQLNNEENSSGKIEHTTPIKKFQNVSCYKSTTPETEDSKEASHHLKEASVSKFERLNYVEIKQSIIKLKDQSSMIRQHLAPGCK